MNWGAALQYILCVAPRCPRGSLVPLYSEEQINWSEHKPCAPGCARGSLVCALMKRGAKAVLCLKKRGASLLQRENWEREITVFAGWHGLDMKSLVTNLFSSSLTGAIHSSELFYLMCCVLLCTLMFDYILQTQNCTCLYLCIFVHDALATHPGLWNCVETFV